MRKLSDTLRAASPPRRLVISLSSALLIAVLSLVACGERAAEAEPSDSVATSATSLATTTATQGTTTTLAASVTTTTSTATTTTAVVVSDAQLEAAAAIGDIDVGEDLFFQALDVIHGSPSCSTCHSLDPTNSQFAPTLGGIWATAGGRVGGLSDVDYLRQSILDPGAFTVEGSWAFAMPPRYPDVLSDDQVNNLVAFLLTQ